MNKVMMTVSLILFVLAGKAIAAGVIQFETDMSLDKMHVAVSSVSSESVGDHVVAIAYSKNPVFGPAAIQEYDVYYLKGRNTLIVDKRYIYPVGYLSNDIIKVTDKYYEEIYEDIDGELRIALDKFIAVISGKNSSRNIEKDFEKLVSPWMRFNNKFKKQDRDMGEGKELFWRLGPIRMKHFVIGISKSIYGNYISIGQVKKAE